MPFSLLMSTLAFLFLVTVVACMIPAGGESQDWLVMKRRSVNPPWYKGPSFQQPKTPPCHLLRHQAHIQWKRLREKKFPRCVRYMKEKRKALKRLRQTIKPAFVSESKLNDAAERRVIANGIFRTLDINNDGVIDKNEMDNYLILNDILPFLNSYPRR